MELYKPFKSKAKNKKYSVYVKGGKLIQQPYSRTKFTLICIEI